MVGDKGVVHVRTDFVNSRHGYAVGGALLELLKEGPHYFCLELVLRAAALQKHY